MGTPDAATVVEKGVEKVTLRVVTLSTPPGMVDEATDLAHDLDEDLFPKVDLIALLALLDRGEVDAARAMAGDHPSALALVKHRLLAV